MPNLKSVIEDIVSGDDYNIQRTVGSIPTSQTVVKAWLAIKKHYDDPDTPTAVIFKEITASYVPGVGQITDNAGITHIAGFFFELTHADTALLETFRRYHFAIKLLTNTGKDYTPEKGILTVLWGGVKAVS